MFLSITYIILLHFVVSKTQAFTVAPTIISPSQSRIDRDAAEKIRATNRFSALSSMRSSKEDSIPAGAALMAAATIVLYSEYTLKTTGCGLPAGPRGIVGAVEGLSYLAVVGLAGYSFYTKVKTGAGLPGLFLGAAEGLSFLAIAVGLLVLGFQLVDYGYVPNAVPMEGGMCQ